MHVGGPEWIAWQRGVSGIEGEALRNIVHSQPTFRTCQIHGTPLTKRGVHYWCDVCGDRAPHPPETFKSMLREVVPNVLEDIRILERIGQRGVNLKTEQK